MTVKHLKKNKLIQDFFDERIDRLFPHLSNFRKDSISVHGKLDRNPHKEEYYVSLNVCLSSITLHSRETEVDLFRAVNSAVSSVIRQAEKLKTKLRRKNRKRRQNIPGNFNNVD